MRAIFFGTPAIAVPSLEALTRIADVAAVVCQPDRPAGRGLSLAPPATKARALELGLRVLQPTKIRTGEFGAELSRLEADVALVLAYGRILPPDVLSAPRRGCLNLHASILPRYRGAAPIQWAVVRGETKTGISLMQMDEGLDTGPVYAIRTLDIGADETSGELAERLGTLAGEVVVADVPRVMEGSLHPVQQVEAEATHAPPLKKEDGRIAWGRPVKAVHDHVRGMHPWPGAFTQAGDKVLKVIATRSARFEAQGAEPGTLLTADANGILIACQDGTIELLRAQIEGRKPLSARELVSGRTLRAGMKLGFPP